MDEWGIETLIIIIFIILLTIEYLKINYKYQILKIQLVNIKNDLKNLTSFVVQWAVLVTFESMVIRSCLVVLTDLRTTSIHLWGLLPYTCEVLAIRLTFVSSYSSHVSSFWKQPLLPVEPHALILFHRHIALPIA